MATRFLRSRAFKELALAKKSEGCGVRKEYLPEIKQEGDSRILQFVISTAAVDREEDTIKVDGWELAAYRANPVVLWSHDAFALPIAQSLTVFVEDDALKSRAEFATREENPLADSVFLLLKRRFLRAASVGFMPIEFAIIQDDDRNFGIDFLRQDLLEWSVVSVPANQDALIEFSRAKQAGINMEPVVEWAERTLDARDLWEKADRSGLWFKREGVEQLRRAAKGESPTTHHLSKAQQDALAARNVRAIADQIEDAAVAAVAMPRTGTGADPELAFLDDVCVPMLAMNVDGPEVWTCGVANHEHPTCDEATICIARYVEAAANGGGGVGAVLALGANGDTTRPGFLAYLDRLDAKTVITWAAAHPDGTPKAPDDEAWDGPAQVASASVEDLGHMATWREAKPADELLKGDFKLPHHKAAGSHSVVFRGVAAAMGALLGARGGVDIPDGQRRGVYNHLARHYREFDKEPPEFRAITIQALGPRPDDAPVPYFFDFDTGDLLSPVFTERGAILGVRIWNAKQDDDHPPIVVQTLIFPKTHWSSAADAAQWARDHDFKADVDDVDETESSYRYRQRPPGEFEDDSMRTFCINPNDVPASDEACKVKAVGGHLKEMPDALGRVLDIIRSFAPDATLDDETIETVRLAMLEAVKTEPGRGPVNYILVGDPGGGNSRIFDTRTGEPLPGVRSVEWGHEAGELPSLVVSLLGVAAAVPALDIETQKASVTVARRHITRLRRAAAMLVEVLDAIDSDEESRGASATSTAVPGPEERHEDDNQFDPETLGKAVAEALAKTIDDRLSEHVRRLTGRVD